MAGRNDQKRGLGYRDRMTRDARQYREDVANNSILSGTYDTLANYLPEQSAAGATRLADYFMPFYGGAATIEEGADTLRDADSLGDYLLGGGQVALGAAEFAPIVGALAKGGRGARFVGDEAGAIRAWHGSPHDFDKFDINKIGTGEGAQAYGHGLYFAENRNVADDYAKTLANRTSLGYFDADFNARDLMQRFGGDKDFVIETLEDTLRNVGDDATKADQLRATIESIKTGSYETADLPKGRLYEVEIDANPEDFLDWDAPLSEQPEGVRKIAETTLAGKRDVNWQFNGYNGGYFQKMPGGGSKKLGDVTDIGRGRLRVKLGKDEIGIVGSESEARAMLDAEIERRGLKTAFNPKGADVYAEIVGGVDSLVHDSPNRVGGTDLMREAGIPGIRYYDQGSRTAGDVNELRGTVSMWRNAVNKNPNDDYAWKMFEDAEAALADAEKGLTRNYVVFDDSLISILRKLGLAGTAPLGAILAGQNEGQ